MIKPENVDAYIARFPKDTKAKLEQIRAIIRKSAPDAEEVISYSMPAYKHKGILVYFAGYTNHIGFYPTSSGIKAFEHELTDYVWSKGAIQFPLNEPMPKTLIESIVRYRLKENDEKQKAKKK